MSENVLLCFFISIPCKAADTYCSTGSNFTQGSNMEQNRNTVVNNLVRHAASSGGFNTTVSGRGPNQIYGLLQCWGDVTTEKCSACSLDINSTIRQLCANAAAALIFVNDNCYLTYASSNFIGKLDNTTEVYRINGENATNPATFSSAVKRLFSNLSAKVEDSPIMFASGFTSEYSQITKIYGLIQCRRDINREDCRGCMGRGISSLLNVSENGYRVGGVGRFGSCLVIIYQTYPFYASNYFVPPTMSRSSKTLPSSSTCFWVLFLTDMGL